MNLKKMAIGAIAAVGMMSAPAKAPAQFDQGTIETVALILLAEKLGIDPNLVAGLTGGGGLGGGSLFDYAPVFAFQQEVPSYSIQNILGMRSQGLSWDQIATRTRIDPVRYRQLRSSGRLDNNNVWRETATNELNLSSDTISRLRNMGFSWKDIVMTTVISRESGRSISDVANRYRRSRNWSTVASYYRVNRDLIAKRIAMWKTSRSVPTTWRSKTTGWATQRFVPPGLAKKGGLPPGQAKKNRGKSKGKGRGN